MSSLFLKIFLWFWMATAVVGLALVAVTISTQPEPDADRARTRLGDALTIHAQAAAAIYERGGRPALRAYLSDLRNTSRLRLWLFDQNGRELSSRAAPRAAQILAQRAALNHSHSSRENPDNENTEVEDASRGDASREETLFASTNGRLWGAHRVVIVRPGDGKDIAPESNQSNATIAQSDGQSSAQHVSEDLAINRNAPTSKAKGATTKNVADKNAVTHTNAASADATNLNAASADDVMANDEVRDYVVVGQMRRGTDNGAAASATRGHGLRALANVVVGGADPRVRALRFLTVFLSAGLVCYALARYVTAPLVDLRLATRRLAAGDLTARVGTPSRNSPGTAPSVAPFSPVVRAATNGAAANGALVVGAPEVGQRDVDTNSVRIENGSGIGTAQREDGPEQPGAVLERSAHRPALGQRAKWRQRWAQMGVRHDEIADLGRDFDLMAERIELLVRSQNRLLGDISHELRSPLARLGLSLEIARRHAGTQATPALDRIEREAARLNTLIGQLLTLAHLESTSDLRTSALNSSDFNAAKTTGAIAHDSATSTDGLPRSPAREASPVDLLLLVREVASDAEFEAKSRNRGVSLLHANTGPRMSTHARASSWLVSGNADLLRSAIENVARNAIRYTPEATSIEITLSREESIDKATRRPGDKAAKAQAPRLESRVASSPAHPVTHSPRHLVTSSPAHAVITVRDHGPGVPPETLGELFRPFYRVAEARDRESGGVGLGLAITERAVRLHGGSIAARNASDGGLIVEIRLPLADND